MIINLVLVHLRVQLWACVTAIPHSGSVIAILRFFRGESYYTCNICGSVPLTHAVLAILPAVFNGKMQQILNKHCSQTRMTHRTARPAHANPDSQELQYPKFGRIAQLDFRVLQFSKNCRCTKWLARVWLSLKAKPWLLYVLFNYWIACLFGVVLPSKTQLQKVIAMNTAKRLPNWHIYQQIGRLTKSLFSGRPPEKLQRNPT